jgi:plastocyanin
MKKSILLIPVLILLMYITSSVNAYATKWIVNVQNFSFTPSELPGVHVNDTIRWVWVSGNHTTTSTTIPAGASTWNSPITQSNPSFEYKALVVGTFNYKCTPHASMGMIATFVVSPEVGIIENETTSLISVSPNPFRENVNISFDSKNSTSIKELQVYDLTGKILHKESFSSGAGLISSSLNLQDLENGLYFFEFVDNSNRTYVKRVIKE